MLSAFGIFGIASIISSIIAIICVIIALGSDELTTRHLFGSYAGTYYEYTCGVDRVYLCNEILLAYNDLNLVDVQQCEGDGYGGECCEYKLSDLCDSTSPFICGSDNIDCVW
eukprot:238893_1